MPLPFSTIAHRSFAAARVADRETGPRPRRFPKGACHMASAWVYQDDKQIKKRGADKASWYVGWIDPDGKRRCESCGPGADGKRLAEKKRKKVEAELITGTYQSNSKKTWEDFRGEYKAKIVDGMETETARLTLNALDHFERLVKP